MHANVGSSYNCCLDNDWGGGVLWRKIGSGYNINLWNPDRATYFTMVPSHHRVWVDGAITRWCDVNDAMVRQCGGDGVMKRWHNDDGTMATTRCSIAPSLSCHRTITLSAFCTRAVWRKWQHDYFAVVSFYDLYTTNQASCMLVLNAMYF